jgi:imidazoleglycerol-phosphate dehydratase/histidinol-phosphatase
MDETQATVSLDLSGRPYLVFRGEFKREMLGGMSLELAKHFFESFAIHSGTTLHIEFYGENDHHKIEAVFKGVARAIKIALETDGDGKSLPSTKGLL